MKISLLDWLRFSFDSFAESFHIRRLQFSIVRLATIHFLHCYLFSFFFFCHFFIFVSSVLCLPLRRRSWCRFRRNLSHSYFVWKFHSICCKTTFIHVSHNCRLHSWASNIAEDEKIKSNHRQKRVWACKRVCVLVQFLIVFLHSHNRWKFNDSFAVRRFYQQIFNCEKLTCVIWTKERNIYVKLAG